MINPYRPPKAAVALPTTPDVLPGAVRALRALAVVGSLFLMLIPVLAIVATRPRGAELIVMLGLSAVVFLLSGASIASLVTRFAERQLFWGTMLLNVLAAVLLLYGFYFGARRSNEVALIFILPVLLNMVAIDQLRRARRARARFASG
jgi:hypothetical protein